MRTRARNLDRELGSRLENDSGRYSLEQDRARVGQYARELIARLQNRDYTMYGLNTPDVLIAAKAWADAMQTTSTQPLEAA